jgi:hypothetical protein
MVYTLDDGQLLSIWAVISQLGLIREMSDPSDRSMLLTRAQALLTMLALEVSPLPKIGTTLLRSDLDQIVWKNSTPRAAFAAE